VLVSKPARAAPPLSARGLLTAGRVVLGGGRSDPKRSDLDLMSPVKTLRVPGPLRHDPHPTPGQHFFHRLAGEVLLFRRVQRHDPTGVIDVPLVSPRRCAIAARKASCSAAFSRRIAVGIGHRAGEIPGKDRAFGSAHDRCSIRFTRAS
jgi:hypothetical protein